MRLLSIALIATLLGAAVPAVAQDTIKIGNETKKTVGTLVKTENGDIACYLELRDDRGAYFSESGDFSICMEEARLIGKRLALTYKVANVLARSCQGDVSCGKSDKIVLVASVKVIEAKPDTKADAKPAAPRPQASFCTAAEQVIFSCRTGTRMVSVCASKDAGINKGYLQYRYGKVDSTEPLEITQPEAQLPPASVAVGQAVPFSGGGGTWLRFTRGTVTYTVYSGIGKWGPKGEIQEKDGLVVERDRKPVASLKCVDRIARGELGPVWFEKVGIKPGNQDFDFPD